MIQIRVFAAALALGLSGTLAACTSVTPEPTSAGPSVSFQGNNRDFGVVPDTAMPNAIAMPQIDPNHTYSLPELIDIAQLHNPVTRASWQRAREAAIAAGATAATYLPVLSADVVAGYAQTSDTVPGVKGTFVDVPPGTITVSGMQVTPGLTVKWLLFDFGGRDAARASAQQLSFAANVTFNATHQKLIFDVSSAFFQLTAARSQTAINREALNNAKVVQSAAQARLKQGVATSMEVAQASQQVAQAEFDLTQATGRERNTYHHLLEAMGVSPTLPIKVQNIGNRAMPRAIPGNLDALIAASLQRRPDVQAALARVKSNRSGIAAAQAEFMPKVALTGTLNRSFGNYSIDDSRIPGTASINASRPNAGLLVGLSQPLFDGGLRDARLQAAIAQAEASEQEFAQLQNMAAREIVIAYDMLRTSLSGHAAANALVHAGQTNYNAALDYFKNGLGTLADVSIAQTGLLKAKFAQSQTLSDAFTAAATIAFATGQLTNASVP